MAFKNKSDLIGWILIFTVILLLIEVTFFNGGLLFSLFISAFLIYMGKKRYHRSIGKLMMLIGIIVAVVSILNMFAFKLLLLSLLGLVIYKFVQSKKNPTVYTPDFSFEKSYPNNPEQLQSRRLLFKNNVIGGQSTPETAYEWEDINIQSGIGDIIVDLSNTVLPKGESVIAIRNIVGTVKVFVPYELEVKVVHSVIAGSVSILHNDERRLFNQSVQYHTSQYEESEHKIKIITSTIVGNIEVKRI